MRKSFNLSPCYSSLYLALQDVLTPSTKLTIGSVIALSLASVSISSQAQTLELSDLNSINGFVINGVSTGDQAGIAVSGLGDINDDGIDDLLIGANGANSVSGESYIVFGSTEVFNNPLDLSDLDGTNGFTIPGIDTNDRAGGAVGGLGDVNDDGIADFIIGALTADANSNDDSGESYVVFGSSQSFPSSLDLTTLDGNNGFVLNGIDLSDQSGSAVSGLGDVNNDGVDDLLIGAFFASPNGDQSGEAYVVFGLSNGDSFPAQLELSDLDGINGFVINGITTNGLAGGTASGLGDVNDDGIDDLIIGVVGGNGGTGAGYVIFGQSNGFASSLDLSTLDGTNGFALNGTASDDFAGGAVSGSDDINGDGIADVIIGANRANNARGETYVVFGHANDSAFANPLDLSTLDGNNGFIISGVAEDDLAGIAVSGIGDFNDDGISDLLIGASGVSTNGLFSGASYVVYGRASDTPFPNPFELSTLDASSGLVINGIAAFNLSGSAVSGVDINDDDGKDLLIGAFAGSPNASGESYVVFGAPATDTTPDQFTFNDPSDVALSTEQVSDEIIVTGINLPAPISITNGFYSINNGAFTLNPGVVNNNDKVRVRHDSAATFATDTDTTLDIGGVSDIFTSTTIASNEPLDLTFTNVTDVPLLSEQTSNAVVVSGVGIGAAISVTNGSYSIDEGSFTTTAGTIDDGQSVRVRHTASGNFSTTVETELTIASTSGIFSSTTLDEDIMPDQFSFTDVTDVALASEQTSNTITVTGINSSATISIVDGSYEIIGSGLGFTAAPGTVTDGQMVRVRHTAAATVSTDTDTTLTIGGVSDTFTSTTITGDEIFDDQFED